MKKFLLSLLCLSALSVSEMQAIDNEPDAGLTHVVSAGMSVANLRGWPVDTKSKVGYSVGWRGEYVLPGAAGTYVNFGLDVQMLGAKMDVKPTTGLAYTDKLRSFYASIPLHVGYRYNLTNVWGVFADFGPYFACGLGGKWDESDNKWFVRDEDALGVPHGCDVKRFDCGLGFRFGAEYNNRLSLAFGFNWGMKNLEPIKGPGPEVKNYHTTITVGYRL